VPIYDQSYRPYRGSFSPHTWRWWTIARTGVTHLLARRWFLIFALAITFGPVLVFGSIIWANHQFPQQRLMPTDAEFFRKLMEFQAWAWFLILGLFPGSGLISNDFKGNAIQLYLSKPLTRLDYVAGKFAVLAAFFLGATLLPGLLLFFLEVGFSSDLGFVSTYWWIPFAMIGYSVFTTVTWGLFVLGLSSLSRSARFVGILLIGLTFLSSGFALALRGILNNSALIVLSLRGNLSMLSYLFFGGESDFGDHAVGAGVVLLLMAAASALVLRARVRAVEVVT
jgi:ABC-2 type transport system permease protein